MEIILTVVLSTSGYFFSAIILFTNIYGVLRMHQGLCAKWFAHLISQRNKVQRDQVIFAGSHSQCKAQSGLILSSSHPVPAPYPLGHDVGLRGDEIV